MPRGREHEKRPTGAGEKRVNAPPKTHLYMVIYYIRSKLAEAKIGSESYSVEKTLNRKHTTKKESKWQKRKNRPTTKGGTGALPGTRTYVHKFKVGPQAISGAGPVGFISFRINYTSDR